MILKALYEYYYRLKDSGAVPPLGFKKQEIHFVIVLDKDGNLMRIEDRRIDKRTAMSYYVIADSRSSDVKPYVLYDNLEYVFGFVKDGKPEKSTEKHNAFVGQCESLAQKYPDCAVFQAIVKFYTRNGVEKVMKDSMWVKIAGNAEAKISFLLDGDTEIAASVKELDNEIDIFGDPKVHPQYCLITGEKAPIVRKTTAVQIRGGNSSGSKIVSFKEDRGYDSYCKKQGFNAPISKTAEAAYSSALLKLLEKDSRNKFSISNRTYVFWASKDNEETEAFKDGFQYLLGSILEKGININEGINKLRALLKSIFTGQIPELENERFYFLGMSPNNTRIAITYWREAPMKDIAEMILRHFDDMDIIDTRKDQSPYMGLYRMLGAVTLGGKASEAQPNLSDRVLKSILEGVPYPYTLYSSCLRRIRAELSDNIPIARVAILKAYINRLNYNQQKLSIMLDKTNTNPGYVCGRLFAVMEYTQKKANGINAIKERYMNAASATPAVVFATLLNLSNHHVEKLDNEGLKIFIENMKQSILSLLPSTGFPSHLNIQDQGRFFVGYYHQMQDLYTSKKEN